MKRLLFILALTACSDMGPRPIIEGAEPYTDTARLAATWSELEGCSGLSGNLSRISFYTATKITHGGEQSRGIWMPDGRIYILATLIADTRLLKHEMMHALLTGEGHPEHYFNNVCGDIR